MKKFMLTTHLPRFSIYFIEELAKRGYLKLLIVQTQEKTYKENNIILIKKIWRLGLYIFRKLTKVFEDYILYRHYYVETTDNNKKQMKGLIAPHYRLKQLSNIYGFEILYTNNINKDPFVMNKLKNSKFDYLLILGGMIIKQEILDCNDAIWINGHGGILPEYRGLNSEYWAIKNKDYNNIGVTIHEANNKIDAGKVLAISRTHYCQTEKLIVLIIRNSLNLIQTYLDTIEEIDNRVLKAAFIDSEGEHYYKKLGFDIRKQYNKKCNEIK